MRPVLALARLRLHTLRNRILDLRRDAIAKSAVVVVGLTLICAVAYATAFWSFRFIETFPAIGHPLNERLLSLFFLLLLVMVALSTAVIVYATLFLGVETEFLFGSPAPPRLVFFWKLGESVAYSSWATLILGIPVLAAFGTARRAPATFYLESAVSLVVFLTFCGLLGAALMLVLLEVVRRWTWRRFLVTLALLVGLPAWLFLRSFDFGGLSGREDLQALDRFTAGIAAIRSPFFPCAWVTSSVVAGAAGNHAEVLFQGGVLLANTLVFLPFLALYGRGRYGRRWLLARDPAGKRAGGRPRRIPFPRGPAAALAWKDALTFARDPAQLSQFILFLLLLAVYVVSLVRIPGDLFGAGWTRLLYFGNLGAICLILSSFSDRFLFPLLSLEGRCIWVVGLAPIEREFLVRQKARLGRALMVSLGLVAGISSNLFLGFDGWPLAGTCWTVALAGWCVASLAAGLGGAYPSFSEDNPARIAVDLNSTLNLFVGSLAIAGILGLEGLPFLLLGVSPPVWSVAAGHAAALAFTLAASAWALRLGRRSLERTEF